jgi:hypothetical protein
MREEEEKHDEWRNRIRKLREEEENLQDERGGG